jgi:hypothetical protein
LAASPASTYPPPSTAPGLCVPLEQAVACRRLEPLETLGIGVVVDHGQLHGSRQRVLRHTSPIGLVRLSPGMGDRDDRGQGIFGHARCPQVIRGDRPAPAGTVFENAVERGDDPLVVGPEPVHDPDDMVDVGLTGSVALAMVDDPGDRQGACR